MVCGCRFAVGGLRLSVACFLQIRHFSACLCRNILFSHTIMRSGFCRWLVVVSLRLSVGGYRFAVVRWARLPAPGLGVSAAILGGFASAVCFLVPADNASYLAFFGLL